MSEKGFVIIDFNKCSSNLLVRIPIQDFLFFVTYGCCHSCYFNLVVLFNCLKTLGTLIEFYLACLKLFDQYKPFENNRFEQLFNSELYQVLFFSGENCELKYLNCFANLYS